MYAQFHGLKEKPFSLLPDPDFLYFSENHRAALDLLELAVMNQSGFCLLSGEIGAGKTTLIRELLNRLDATVAVGLVSNTHPSFGELLHWVMAAYGLQCESTDRITLHKTFIEFAIQNYAKGMRTLLIIDEAQNLSPVALEELRMLSNVNSGKDMVLQLMLVGQQQLRSNLQQPDLAQFVQRIGVDFHLGALNKVETGEYIRYRVGHAGGSPALFSESACEAVYRASKGVPRLINRICDLALVYAFSEQKDVVEAGMIETVVVDQEVGDVLEAARTRESAPAKAQVDEPEQNTDSSINTLDSVSLPDLEQRAAVSLHEQVTLDPVTTADEFVTVDNDTPQVSASEHDITRQFIRDAQTTASDNRENPEIVSELHRMVVDAERHFPLRGYGDSKRKHTLKLTVALSVALVGIVSGVWLSRDIWSAWPVGDWYRSAQARIQLLAELPGTSLKDQPSVPIAERTAVDAIETPRQSESVQVLERAPVAGREPPASSEERSDQSVATVEDEMDVEQAQRALTGSVATPEPNTTMADDARQRELERLAQLEEESRRLALERREAERKFAEQLRERHALERKAREERERILAAKAAIERAAAERNRVEQAAIESAPEVPAAAQKTPEPTKAGPDDSSIAEMSSDQGRLLAPRAERELARTPSSMAASDTETDTETDSYSSTGFQSNPCDGPTARFMSTCISR